MMKPCPFCGWQLSKAQIDKEWEGGRYYVVCRSCLALGPVGKTKKMALEYWNERRHAAGEH